MKYSNRRSYRDFELVVEGLDRKKVINKSEKTVFTGITKILKDILDGFQKIKSKFF